MNFNKVEFEASFGTSKQIKLSCCPEFVFAGRSNVGKSSLINKLVNRKSLARVSATPGKTGTINFYKLLIFYSIYDMLLWFITIIKEEFKWILNNGEILTQLANGLKK